MEKIRILKNSEGTKKVLQLLKTFTHIFLRMNSVSLNYKTKTFKKSMRYYKRLEELVNKNKQNQNLLYCYSLLQNQGFERPWKAVNYKYIHRYDSKLKQLTFVSNNRYDYKRTFKMKKI